MRSTSLFLTLGLSVGVLTACSADGRDDLGAVGAPSASVPGTDPSPGGPGGSLAGGATGGGGGASSGGSSGAGSPSDAGSAATDGGAADGGGPTTGAGPSGPTPWDASPCPGGAIQSSDLLSRFAPAATTTTFGTVWVDARQRQCQDQTGCQGWTASSVVDLYRIAWSGNGFTFPAASTVAVPSSGTITCTVPGPSCKLTVGAMTSNVYPPEQGRPLGITPRVAGSQVQVGNWSPSPQGNYIQYTSSVVAPSCLWGSMSGRVYGASGTYVETQMIVWGAF